MPWLTRALFAPDAPARFVAGRVPPPPGGRRFEFIAEPGTGDVRLLMPVDARAAGSIARRGNDARSLLQRGRSLVAEAAFRTGTAQRVLGRRVTLVIHPEADRPDRSLIAEVEAQLDCRADALAVTLGPQRYNRKPVVAFFANGIPLVVAKVAADPVTDDLVANEVGWLRQAAHRGVGFTVPAIRHEGTWNDRRLVAMEPFSTPRLPRARRGRLPETWLVRAIADLEPMGPVATRCSPVLADALNVAPPGGRLEAAARAVVDRYGDVEVDHGAWHGDLSPWNLATTGRGMIVWDWEMAASGRPVGADRAHAAVMSALEIGRDAPARSVAAASTDAYATFQPEGSRAAARSLHLIDLARREQSLGRSGDLPGLAAPAMERVLCD